MARGSIVGRDEPAECIAGGRVVKTIIRTARASSSTLAGARPSASEHRRARLGRGGGGAGAAGVVVGLVVESVADVRGVEPLELEHLAELARERLTHPALRDRFGLPLVRGLHAGQLDDEHAPGLRELDDRERLLPGRLRRGAGEQLERLADELLAGRGLEREVRDLLVPSPGDRAYGQDVATKRLRGASEAARLLGGCEQLVGRFFGA